MTDLQVIKPNELQQYLENGLGHAANQASKISAFHTYREKLAENTQKIHIYALERFAQFLNDSEAALAQAARSVGLQCAHAGRYLFTRFEGCGLSITLGKGAEGILRIGSG